ncbi:PD-(D/E)XK nuclease family protein, partial [Desertibacillus haloalkaliphilus]
DNGLTNEAAIREAVREEEEQWTNMSMYEHEMNILMNSYTDEVKQGLGETIETEWPFVTSIEGVDIIGEIDKVTRRNSGYHIIDFKTNKIFQSGSELVDLYWSQLYLYKLAYEQESG